MESRLQRSTSRCDRYHYCRRAAVDAFPMTSTLVAVLFSLIVLQIVSNTDQAALTVNVVRVVRVDVPSVVRSYDAKPDPAATAVGGVPPPLLLGCVYALEGGENDDENGDVIAPTDPRPVNGTASTANGARDRRSSSPAPDLAMDAAMEEVQRLRGLVVKWYFRRNPIPAAPKDAMAIINDNEQVYQWIAGGGPEAGGGLGPLSGRTVDVTAETPRADRSYLHRVIRVERPTAELTGEYRCQVEDWNSERRSAWHPMVVYTPERIFKISVDDNDDDDEDDIAEGSGGDLNFTTTEPTTSSAPPTGPKKWPTEINITCYAAGMHPEPSMSIWVNGVSLDSVTSVVTEDDGDNDETNDGAVQTTTASMTTSTTTTTTTTTAKPKAFRNRYRGQRAGEEEYKKYAVSATSVVSLKDAEEYRNSKPHQHQRRRNTVDVECRLRVPGDGAGNGHWKADRSADLYYSARKSVAYKYRNDLPPPGDAFAAVSSASSVADDDADDADTYGNGSARGADNDDAPNAQGADDAAVSGAASVTLSFSAAVVRSVQTIAAAAVVTAAARR